MVPSPPFWKFFRKLPTHSKPPKLTIVSKLQIMDLNDIWQSIINPSLYICPINLLKFFKFTSSIQRFWWSSGMIPEKVTWVRFPVRISTVFSKLAQSNDLIFQFLIEYWHICFDKFSYRISDQEISYQELCSAILFKFCNFSQIFSFLYADLAIPRKI